MVSMKNIKLEDGVISFVGFAENDPNQSFTVKLDANDFHVIENSLGGMNTYCRMAINKVSSTLVEEKNCRRSCALIGVRRYLELR